MLRIDSSTNEGKKILAELLMDVVLNEPMEEVPAPYQVRTKAYCNYESALIVLAKLKGQGKLNFEYDSIYHPYVMHMVYVNWNHTASGMVEICVAEVMEILKGFDCVLIDETDPFVWQLSVTIYVSV